MAPTTPATHDSALAQPASNAAPQATSALPTGIAGEISASDLAAIQNLALDQNQIMHLLRSLPGVFKQIPNNSNPKEDAAQALSNLSQTPFVPPHFMPPPGNGLPGINDPGPSSHPRGPPGLGQLSSVAMQAAPASVQQPQQQSPQQSGADDHKDHENASGGSVDGGSPAAPTTPAASASTGGRRGARSAAMGSDEWSRQRKDNHKEVERRRRGNINEGINELGRIVPNGSGEKAKGAILSRAVQYIHHLKENEARNIEKWTLEKLLMDQAMGDLQAQLEEVKRMWDEERLARQRLENELAAFRGMGGASKDDGGAGTKRRSVDNPSGAGESEGDRDGKRQKTE